MLLPKSWDSSLQPPTWPVLVHAVPLYDSLGETAVQYTINHSEASVIFVSDAKLPMLLLALPNLKRKVTVVYWGLPSKKDLSSLSALVRPFSHLRCRAN